MEIKERSETGVRILIVDDERAVASILRDLLSAGGRSIDVCHDGVEAIELIQENAYDLIIVDLVMPRVGGLEVLRFAKKTRPDTIVVIITGHASLETAITAIKEGAYDYIKKPCKLDEIKIVVDNAIEKIMLNRENRNLMIKLQDAYNELIALKKEKCKEERIANINFFPSNMPGLHYLYESGSSLGNCVDQLKELSSLRESGALTEAEFNALKKRYLRSISLQE